MTWSLVCILAASSPRNLRIVSFSDIENVAIDKENECTARMVCLWCPAEQPSCPEGPREAAFLAPVPPLPLAAPAWPPPPGHTPRQVLDQATTKFPAHPAPMPAPPADQEFN